MVIAIDKDREWEFICPSDLALHKPTQEQKAANLPGDPITPESERTTFILRALTPKQLADVTDMGLTQDRIGGKIQFAHANQVVTICILGIVGWRNLKDRRGVEVTCPENPLDRIALLPEIVRAELSQEIRYNAELTASEGN